MRPTLVIADDHEILRDALAGHAAKNAGFTVVASVGDAQSAVNACHRLRPDILLLDIEMPGRDALAAIADVRAVSPGTRIVILTAYCRDAFIQVALDNGAAGYLLKTEPPPTLFAALERVAAGGTAFSVQVQSRMAQREIKAVGRDGGAGRDGGSRIEDLTPRELEVLRYIGRGLDNDQMAEVMTLSKRTVERHIARLMDAVAIRERAGLMKLAYEQGLVTVLTLVGPAAFC